MTKILEGTWAEIRAQQPDWENKRLRVEVLDAPETQNAPSQNAPSTNEDDFSLADRLRGRVGTVSFEPTDLAARSEYYYALAMDEKYPDGAQQADESP